MKRNSPSPDKDVHTRCSCLQAADYEEGSKRRKVLQGEYSGSDPLTPERRKLLVDLCKAADQKRRLSLKVEDKHKNPGLTLSESALQHFVQEKRAAFDLVKVRCYDYFWYSGKCFSHINFEARPVNPGAAEPSVKLFFAELICEHPKSPVVTFCNPIEPTNKVTEGCVFCHRGSLIIHPISDVMERDRRFSPGKHMTSGKYPDMASFLPGIPPWQLNHPGVVQAYDANENGYYQADEGVRGEMSLEEYLNFRKTRVQQLSEAVVEDLKMEKGTDLNLVEGLEFSTFKYEGKKFHHLNFKAKPQGPQFELSIRLYFAEMVNDGGSYCVTFCCVVDPADKVLARCRFCGGRGVQQPDISSGVDLEFWARNVLYQDRSGGLPCMFPSRDDDMLFGM